MNDFQTAEIETEEPPIFDKINVPLVSIIKKLPRPKELLTKSIFEPTLPVCIYQTPFNPIDQRLTNYEVYSDNRMKLLDISEH